MFSIDLWASPRWPCPAGLHGGLGGDRGGLLCPGARRGRAREADPVLPGNSDQTAIEIMRLVLADETTPVPRREIVVPLFDNNKIFDHRKNEGK
jgi:hypothetical protein